MNEKEEEEENSGGSKETETTSNEVKQPESPTHKELKPTTRKSSEPVGVD